jgi:hypothetical protein
MAQATGYICDVCERFTLRKPTDWFILTTENGSGKLDICTNRCLANLARDRLKAERDAAPVIVAAEDKPKPPVFSAKDREISDEEKLAIVEEALTGGVKAVADAHNLPWQAVARWKTELVGKTP